MPEVLKGPRHCSSEAHRAPQELLFSILCAFVRGSRLKGLGLFSGAVCTCQGCTAPRSVPSTCPTTLPLQTNDSNIAPSRAALGRARTTLALSTCRLSCTRVPLPRAAVFLTIPSTPGPQMERRVVSIKMSEFRKGCGPRRPGHSHTGVILRLGQKTKSYMKRKHAETADVGPSASSSDSPVGHNIDDGARVQYSVGPVWPPFFDKGGGRQVRLRHIRRERVRFCHTSRVADGLAKLAQATSAPMHLCAAAIASARGPPLSAGNTQSQPTAARRARSTPAA